MIDMARMSTCAMGFFMGKTMLTKNGTGTRARRHGRRQSAQNKPICPPAENRLSVDRLTYGAKDSTIGRICF